MPHPIWIIEMLNQLDSALKEEWEERAAIMEFDGGLPQDHAECLALLCILRTHPLVLSEQQREKEDLI